MKRKNFFPLSCLFLLLFSSVTFASDGVNTQGLYIAGRLGASFLNDSTISAEVIPFTIDAEFDTGIFFEGAVGYDFGMFRLEVEIGYQKNDVDKFSGYGESVSASGYFDALSSMTNGYLDFENHTAFTPYIGAGIGYAVVSVNDISIGDFPLSYDNDTVFAYQFGVGVGYSATKNLIIDLAYKYFATEDADFESTKVEYNSHNIAIGIRYAF